MPWFLMAALVLIVALLGFYWSSRSESAVMQQGVRWIAVFGALAAALWFATIGRFIVSALLVLIAAAIMARRLFPAFEDGRISPGPRSQVQTRFLRMTLDHINGQIDGMVREGRFSGRRLGDLTRTELTDLFEQLKVDDGEGAKLLDAYLAQAFSGEWEEEITRDYGSGGEMTRDEAFEVLGLRPGATVGDIKIAHRRLMKKFHPDQGGSTYFAARINQAKDLLLRS